MDLKPLLALYFFAVVKGAFGGSQNDIRAPLRPSVVNLGALFTFNSTIGKVAKLAIELAVEDVNKDSSILPRTRLNVIMQDTSCSDFIEFTQALQLMERDVVSIIGPQSSSIAHVISPVANALHVPLVSFAATDPTLTSLQNLYFIQMTQSDYFQMNAIADIVQYYGWSEVSAIFVDDEYGRGGISALGDALANRRLRISYKAAFPPNASDSVMSDLLVTVSLMESRIYVVHVNPDTGLRIFSIAKSLGMMDSGYAWIATDWLTSVLDSSDPTHLDTMSHLHGVIALRHHTADSYLKRTFISRWSDMIRKGNASSGLNAYGLYAYDSVWMLAHALDQFLNEGWNISFSRDPRLHDAKGSVLHLAALQAFEGGENLRQKLLVMNFTGVTGQLQLDSDGNLIHPAYEIINQRDTYSVLVGYWSNYSGLSVVVPETLYGKPPNTPISSHQLHDIIWPGETTIKPRGWVFPNNGKSLRIGIPNRATFKQFVSIGSGPENVGGYCIDVFNAALKLLPYPVLTSFTPIGDGKTNFNYDDIIRMVAQNELDAAVGDIAIRVNRTKFVDFTQPYSESGLVIVAPVKVRNSGAWAFLKPFTLQMWLMIFAFFFTVGVVIWILERRTNDEFRRGSPRQQLVTIFWFSFSTMVFAQREKTESTLGRFVLIIWLFVVLIITSSYTASLTSILTVQQLSSGIEGLDSLIARSLPIGYGDVKYIKDYLMEEFNIPEHRLVPLSPQPEVYARALDLGPKAGGVIAIVDELPYIKVFLSLNCKYTIVGQEFSKSGWGFAFPRDSPLAVDFSTAILALSENGDLQNIHDKWLTNTECTSQNTEIGSNRLSFKSFWGLFLMCGITCLVALLMFFTRLYCQYRKFNRTEAGEWDESLARNKGPIFLGSFKKFISFASLREEEVKSIIKRKSSGKQHQNDQSSDMQFM